jgi:hypothetical protein
MEQLEARPYGPEISNAEREVLRAQVAVIDKDIISWREAPVTTTYQVDVFGEKLADLAQVLDDYYLLIDLSETIRPSAAVLERLRQIMSNQHKLRHAAVFTGKNFILNVAARFVLARIGFASFSIHKTREEALDAITRARS